MATVTKQLHTGDGATTQYVVNFPFISSSHVQVWVNTIQLLDPLHYSLNGSTVTFLDAPEVDDAILIKRVTSPDNVLVDFVDGSVLRESDLDTAYLHNLYLSQEYQYGFNQLIEDALLQIASGTGIIETETDAIIAALVNEMLDQEAAAELRQRVTDIDTNAESILQLGTDLQVQINTLASGIAATIYIQAAEPVPGVSGIPDPIPEGARWYDSDDNNAPYIYQSSSWVSIEDPRIGQAVADISVLTTNVSNNAAAVVAESLARSTADSALASTLALIGAQNGGQTAFIVDTATVKIDSDGGDTFATRFNTLSAADSTNSADISTEQSARITADGILAADITLLGARNGASNAFILNEDTVKIDSDGGDTLAERFSALVASDGTNAADIASEEAARVSATGANASAITTLSGRVATAEGDINSAEVNITANANAITTANGDISTLEAKYGVTLNVNGYVTGFAQNNDGSTGSFVILADKFAIVDPSGDPSETEFTPFSVSGGVVTMQNVAINGNLVVAGSITSSEMESDAITEFTVNDIPAVLNATADNNWKVADEIDVTTVAGDKVEILARLEIDFGAQAQAQIRIRRFDGVTPTAIIGSSDTQTLRVANGYRWENHYMWRIDEPTAKDAWTYKLEVYVPSAASTAQITNVQLAAKRYKR